MTFLLSRLRKEYRSRCVSWEFFLNKEEAGLLFGQRSSIVCIALLFMYIATLVLGQ